MLALAGIPLQSAIAGPLCAEFLHGSDGTRRGNTVAGSRRNIEEHYDAGNAMYSLFLDETLTYSGGIHNPGAGNAIQCACHNFCASAYRPDAVREFMSVVGSFLTRCKQGCRDDWPCCCGC